MTRRYEIGDSHLADICEGYDFMPKLVLYDAAGLGVRLQLHLSWTTPSSASELARSAPAPTTTPPEATNSAITPPC